ncbi:MAG: ABC transporter substrate-binding protein [Candidatus Thorarchaeota archaeon]
MNKTQTFRILVMILLVSPLLSPLHAVTAEASESEVVPAGPSLDKVVYNVITDKEEMLQSIENGTIDILFDKYDMDTDAATFIRLTNADDVKIAPYARNGYGYMTLNTAKYPLSETSLRRAIAFALDKEGICEDAWEGTAQPQDSVVPLANPYCIEGQLSYSYYDADVSYGNQLLDDAGFTVNATTGFRMAPNGSAFDILIEVAQSSNIAIECGLFFEEALLALHIDAESVPTDYFAYLNRIYVHDDYDIAFTGTTFSGYDLDWLIDYTSSFADEDYFNFPAFQNATYDSNFDKLNGSNYAEVLDAVYQMQSILAYECPIIVLYNNHIEFGAYRTDVFDGFVIDRIDSIPCWWTNYLASSGSLGGTLTIGIPSDTDSFNFMTASSDQSKMLLSNMYDSLFRRTHDGSVIPWLAKSVTTQTHDDNPSVAVGFTRLTFELRDGLQWSDGSQLTSEDVAFTLNYYNSDSGNPFDECLEDMNSATVLNATAVVVSFESTMFWDFESIFFKPIIPKAEFEFEDVSGWHAWNPNATTGIVASGPYVITDYVASDYIEFSVNSLYFTNGDLEITTFPQDITYTLGATGNSITWVVTCSSSSHYEVYQNDTLLTTNDWDGSDIIVNVDGLDVGSYKYELIVFDELGNSESDTVYVTVEPTGEPSGDGLTTDMLTTLLIVGSVVGVLVVVVLIVRGRR